MMEKTLHREKKYGGGGRIDGLDILRSLAAFYVVLNHSIEPPYHLNLEYVSSMPFRAKIFCFAGFTLGRSGVPIFLLLSGYLLVSREYDAQKTLQFYKNNLLSLLLTWEIWILIYNLFLMWFNKKPFDIGTYIRNVFFLQKVDLNHTWYIPMIIGMYIFLPYAANILHTVSTEILLIFMIIVYGYLYIVSSINLFLLANSLPQLISQLDLSYSGNVYGFYLLLGYCIRRWEIEINKLLKRPVVVLGIVGVLVCNYLLTIYTQITLYDKQYAYNVWYNYFSMPLIGIAWFLLLKNVQLKIGKSIITQTSMCSFGIYLLHRPVQMIIIRWIEKIGDKSIEMIVNVVGTYLLTFCIVWIICRVPHCGKIFFMYKEKPVAYRM